MIFIDANTYLRFFDSVSGEMQKLLKSIDSIKENIFVTQQIVDEVNRNKLGATTKTLAMIDKTLQINHAAGPLHFDPEDDETAKEWNDKWEDLTQQKIEMKKEFRTQSLKLLKTIQASEDKVSIALSNIFDNAAQASDEETAKARHRKEIGNPPGKSKDPMGDQISWEQLLSHYDGVEDVWIITGDKDFYSKFGGELLLKPFLLNELQEITKEGKPNIWLFDKLSPAVTAMKNEGIVEEKDMPDKEEMEEIELEEDKIISSPNSLQAMNSLAEQIAKMQISMGLGNTAEQIAKMQSSLGLGGIAEQIRKLQNPMGLSHFGKLDNTPIDDEQENTPDDNDEDMPDDEDDIDPDNPPVVPS